MQNRICVLGSSFSRGAQGPHVNDTSSYIHNMLSLELGMEVINLCVSGHGNERYLENYLMACKRYRPDLFLAEIWRDRTFCQLWLPTPLTGEVSRGTPSQIYEHNFPMGLNDGKPYDFKDIWKYKVFRHDDAQGREAIMDTSEVRYHKLSQLLKMYTALAAYMEHPWLMTMRTMKNLQALEEASDFIGVPVLWYTYTEDVETKAFKKFSDTLPTDRHLNSWCGLAAGTYEWAADRFNGQHLADQCHLNKAADQAVVSELTAPFIRNYINKLAGKEING